MLWKNLVCSGGGIKGLAFLGALRALEEHQPVADLTGFAGSSSGAITAGLLAVRCPIERLGEILATTDFERFKDDSFGVIRDTYRVFEEYGYYKGDYFRDWYAALLDDQTGVTDITFKGVFDTYGTDLKITTSNLNRQRGQVYDHVATPDMKVVDAVRASMSIPLFFKCARNDDNDVLVDGGLLNNYPIYLFDNIDETLGLKLTPGDKIASPIEPVEIADIYQYANALVGVLLEQIDRLHIRDDYWKVTVPIDTGSIKTTDFNLTDDEKSFLVDSGYESVTRYIRHRSRL